MVGVNHVPVAQLPAQVAFYGLVICWWWFGLTFWLRKHPPQSRAVSRDLSSYVGMALQSAGYLAIWYFPFLHRRPVIASRSSWLAWTMAVLSISIAAFSAWFVNAAARRLGKQWSLAARIVEGHDLIQDGPYRFVRNPIYSGMFGMLVGTGLAVSPVIPLLIGSAVFLAGTYVRVRIEERLLGSTFGAKFEDYKRRVPALIPGVW